MNKINIAKILKDKPQGTKLYTPISGDVWLVEADEDWKQKIGIYEIQKWCYLKDLI